MTKIKVSACPRASVLEGGSLIEMELRGAEKERVTLQFDPAELDQFLARSIQLIADARNQKHAIADHPGAPALVVVAAGAGPAVGGSHVIVFLKTNTGAEYRFGIPLSGAEQLGEHIATAVEEARMQAAKTRQ